jgi:hypothetical protein
MMEPRMWESLDAVPEDVEVYDTGYRIWYVRAGYAERYYRAGDIPIVWERPAMQGPFTEVLT